MTGAARLALRRELAARNDRLARHARDDPAEAIALADFALDHGFEEEALASVARAAERYAGNPDLWQFLALLYRALDQSEAAVAAFRSATRLAPDRVRAAHGLALASHEGGLPAAALYRDALALAPQDNVMWIGLAASLAVERDGDAALDLLAERLDHHPEWTEGHLTFARMSTTQGQQERATETIDRALADRPRDSALHFVRLSILARAATPAERLAAVAEARRLMGDSPALRAEDAVAASEAGLFDRADAQFVAIGYHQDPNLALAQLRHLIRTARFDQAEVVASRLVATPAAVTAWAYRQLAWRMLGDNRVEWLDQGGALVTTTDLTPALPPLPRLADLLRGLHVATGQPLDQSVRGGTQTDGRLFARIEPEIGMLRNAVRAAVRRYRDGLPSPDPAHPLLSASRLETPRVTGSWSVRLMGGGHHVSHIHDQGWLSAALHISLPNGEGGSLALDGPPKELSLPLPARLIEPIAGRLVLFPSYLWHGTTPFASGERLTIAFDVSRPLG